MHDLYEFYAHRQAHDALVLQQQQPATKAATRRRLIDRHLAIVRVSSNNSLLHVACITVCVVERAIIE